MRWPRSPRWSTGRCGAARSWRARRARRSDARLPGGDEPVNTKLRCLHLLSGLVLLGGCATSPQDDGLLASTPIVRALARESGDVVEVARFSRMRAGAPLPVEWLGWGLQSGRRPTEYRLVASPAGTVLEAYADAAA